ncbi:class II aldolase/adducin family protein [Alicyclobacillus macrosporangiidus]|uniref:class II aldolase/adducin family protein n=1 Tax=Alicyclobacillus macrosporangiidus TaxID=392015 RepID=UPI0034E98691
MIRIVRKHPGLPAVLLANHGVLAFASDPMQTARLLATLDEAATLALWAQAVGGAKSPPRRPMRRLNPV